MEWWEPLVWLVGVVSVIGILRILVIMWWRKKKCSGLLKRRQRR
ncbi:hypothetical protein ES703_82639 [subsurface metagenome]